MLRVHVLRPGGHQYYVDELVPGMAEGTALGGEAPGRWQGRGASDMGLFGTVQAVDLAHLLHGRDPANGRQLRVPRAHGTAGFDLTFSAPKSVSILHLLSPAEMGHEVGAGHATAVDDALSYLERAAAGVRRSDGGRPARLDASGLAAGTFLHRTSRTLDPHLHTHVVVANVAQGLDGAWSSLDSRRLFRHVAAAQALYHARLRAELTERLGVAWEVGPSGMGDVVGVDHTLRGLFSGRSADMTAHLRDRRPGEEPGGGRRPASRRVAALVTRPPKDRSWTVDDLVERWRARALEFGYPPGELTRVVGLGRSAPPVLDRIERSREGSLRLRGEELGPDPRLLRRRLRALDADRGLGRPQLITEVARASPRGAPAALVEDVADRLTTAVGAPGSGAAGGPGGRRRLGAETRWPPGELADALDAVPLEGWAVSLDRQPTRRQTSSTRTFERDIDRARRPAAVRELRW